MPRQFTAAERAAIKAAVPREHHGLWDAAMDAGADPRLGLRQANGLRITRDDGSTVLVLGRRKYLDDGTPIDTDLEAGPPGFLAAGKVSLGYGFRLRDNGGYEVESGGVTTEIGPPEWWTGTQWQHLPLTQRTVIKNRVEWVTPQGMFRVFVLPHLVGTEMVLTGPEHGTGWRQSIAETGGSVAVRDGSWHADSRFGMIPVRVEAGFVVYDPPDLSGVQGPVEVRL